MDHSDNAHSTSDGNDTIPYKVGDILPLQTGDRTIYVLIESISLPFTETCSMVVSFVPPLNHHQILECSTGHRNPARSINYNKAILKMFDWRYATQVRTSINASDWDAERKNVYLNFVRSGRARRYLDCLRQRRMFGESERRRCNVEYIEAENVLGGVQVTGVQHEEVCLLGLHAKWYHREVAVYERMRAYQGREIPRLVDTVTMRMDGLEDRISEGDERTSSRSSSSGSFHDQIGSQSSSADDELSTIRGILIEHIEGFTLDRLSPRNTPKYYWQAIFDQALRNTRLISSHNILNLNVHPRDIMVCQNTDPNNPNRYRVVNFDFRSCRLRRNDEGNLSWRIARFLADEEAKFGARMQSRLKCVYQFDLDVSGAQGDFQLAGEEILNLIVEMRRVEQMQED